MTSHRDSHNTTDVKPEMIPGLYAGNGISHDEYNIAALSIGVQTEKMTFSCKDDCTLTNHTGRWNGQAGRQDHLLSQVDTLTKKWDI